MDQNFYLSTNQSCKCEIFSKEASIYLGFRNKYLLNYNGFFHGLCRFCAEACETLENGVRVVYYFAKSFVFVTNSMQLQYGHSAPALNAMALASQTGGLKPTLALTGLYAAGELFDASSVEMHSFNTEGGCILHRLDDLV